jgi:hypothetical protein
MKRCAGSWPCRKSRASRRKPSRRGLRKAGIEPDSGCLDDTGVAVQTRRSSRDSFGEAGRLPSFLPIRQSYPRSGIRRLQTASCAVSVKGAISKTQSAYFLDELAHAEIVADEVSPRARQSAVMDLARTYGLTAYDATYLELAMRRAATSGHLRPSNWPTPQEPQAYASSARSSNCALVTSTFAGYCGVYHYKYIHQSR